MKEVNITKYDTVKPNIVRQKTEDYVNELKSVIGEDRYELRIHLEPLKKDEEIDEKEPFAFFKWSDPRYRYNYRGSITEDDK